tara:strand:+ start:711 stop:899 length:189 start_codon:yes stop_codon:yes gene_type:complete
MSFNDKIRDRSEYKEKKSSHKRKTKSNRHKTKDLLHDLAKQNIDNDNMFGILDELENNEWSD